MSGDELLETGRAFDTVAATYHASNARNRVLCAMRRQTLTALVERIPTGSSVLDLGCGPGTDAEFLARRGYRVTAIDWSPGMVDETRRRIREARLERLVEVRHLGIHQLDRLEGRAFDAACSNLGPLNCVPDLSAAARLIFHRLRPDAPFVASVIGRICPLEVALYVLRGEFRRAVVRFSREFVPVPFNGGTVWTRYYAPGEFSATFTAAGFECVSVRALGLLTPPPYMEAFTERHPRFVARLQVLEDRLAVWPGLKRCGDHFLVVMRRA